VANVRVQKTGGAIGTGWDEEVQWSGFFPTYCLQPIKNHTVSVTFPDGKVYKFQAVSTPQCQQIVPIDVPQIGFTQVSTGSATAGATLTPVGDTDLLLDAGIPGPVNLINAEVEFADFTQFQLTTADGYKYLLDQKLGATSVTDRNGNTLTISPAGVTNAADPAKSVAFTRDSLQRITAITDPSGQILSYAYNGAGDLVSFTDRDGNATTFSYDSAHLLTDVIDPRGVHAVRNTFDATGRLTSTTDANGNTITYAQDVAAQHEIITDRLGNPTLYEYDDHGNVVRVTDVLGNVTASTYDANDNRISETNALGKTTTYTYDAAGNQTSETDPLGHVTKYAYNSLRQMTTVTDGAGHTITNVYDANGNLSSTTNATGKKTTYTYSAAGMPASITDPLGNQTLLQYDSSGNLAQQTDTLGHVTTYTYDANGNKLTETVRRTRGDGTTETLTTRFEYDGNNRLTKKTNPDGSFTSTTYDPNGQPVDITDELGRATHHEYDSSERPIRTTYPDGTSESSTYDAEGHRLSTTDRGGRSVSFTYDPLGRLTQVTLPDGSTTKAVYDGVGHTVTAIDALQHSTAFSYDDAGHANSVTDALGNKISFAYDAAGNQVSATDALGRTTKTDYDAAGRRIKITYPDGTTQTTVYDDLGREISKTDQAGKTTAFGYDNAGRVTSVTDALGQITSYAYDEVGNRISQTDANGHATSFAYDSRGRRTQIKLPLGQTEQFTYDAAGNLASRTDFNGKTTTYTYDALHNLLARVPDPSFNVPSVSYTYTPSGKRATMTDVTGTTNYTYDSRDRLLSKATPFGALSYTYDTVGNVLTISSSHTGGASVVYGYDELNRLATVTDSSGTTSYSYDAIGNLAQLLYPNSVTQTYTYNPLNHLTNLAITGPSSTPPGSIQLAAYTYTVGPSGRRLSVSEQNGRTVHYTYDDIYRLTSESVVGATSQNGTVSYQYDKVGNRTGVDSTLPAVPAALVNYDANDRDVTNPYDSNGNLLSNDGGGNVYDFEDRLVQHGFMTIAYDGDGNRVAKTVVGVTTNYLVDSNNPSGLPQVLEELQNNVVVRSYTYGTGLINERQTISGVPAASFYGYDGNGSVRILTDVAGHVTDTYDYDAFGNLIGSTGSTPNNYLFAGEQFDPDLNLYYNRARYLDVRTGRFISMDTANGSLKDPGSLHRYLYCGSSPVGCVDPTGHEADLAEVSVSMGIAETLFSSSITQGALFGAVFGCIGGALDRDSSCARGALFGALTGAVLGPLGNSVAALRFGKLALAIAGSGLAGWSSYNAYQQKKYGLAAFYAVTAIGSWAILALTNGGPSASPSPDPEPLTGPPLPGPSPDYQNPWAGEYVEMVTGQAVKAYRVSAPDRVTGSWVFPFRPATGPEAIAGGALPPWNPATMITEVTIPAGTTIRLGIANGIFNQPGGAIQIEILGDLSPVTYGTPQPLPIGLLPPGGGQ
jgi:RHS repeat-associated protein